MTDHLIEIKIDYKHINIYINTYKHTYMYM